MPNVAQKKQEAQNKTLAPLIIPHGIMVFIIHTHDTGRQDDRTAGQAPSSFIDRYIDTDCTYRLQTYCMYTKRRSAVQLF